MKWMTVSRKEKNTPTPHDAAFRAFMSSAEVARDFVELHLPAEYRQLCDLSTLRLEPCTFVDQDLKQYACDALFSMKTCLLYTSPSPRDIQRSRMPSSA